MSLASICAEVREVMALEFLGMTPRKRLHPEQIPGFAGDGHYVVRLTGDRVGLAVLERGRFHGVPFDPSDWLDGTVVSMRKLDMEALCPGE